MKYISSILLSLFCLTLQAQANVQFTPALKKAYGYITQLRFAEAKSIVQEERRQNPKNRVCSYLEAAMLCAELFVNEDQERFAHSQDRIDELMDEIRELNENNPYRNLYLGEIYVANATLNGKFKNNIKAAWQFYKAYDLLGQNYKRFPEFMPTYIPLGVLYAAIGSLPDDYRSLASLLGFEGSVQGGINMIRKAFWRLSADEELNFYRPYAGFVYSYVTYQLGSTDKVSPQELGLDVAHSSFLIYVQALINIQDGEAEKALKWLDARPQGLQYLPFNYMDYLQGKILLGLDPDRSVTYFNRYLQENTSKVYVKSTYRYLSWYYLLKGKEKRAEEMRDNIFRLGDANTGADRQALEEATKGFNKTLVEARVLFDVGKYSEAERVLKRKPVQACCTDPAEEAEYYYRYGRIKEEAREDVLAIQWFQKCLGVVQAEDSYALGNSALQLGVLYERSGDKPRARSYYKKALSYSGYPFYEGIHQKAKTALSRL